MVTIKDFAARCLGIVLLVGAATALAPSPVPVVGLGTQGRCTYHRAFGMMGAHCSALNLHSVPATLKTNIQILDVSFNRIRDIRNTTFQRYTSLRYLYMGDNMIQTIEAGTFYPLTSLETLDLSINALTTIPEFILNLPTLRKLYMSDNSLINLSNDLKKMEKPIKAPLHFLSLSNCHLTEIPDFGVIAELEHLNISGNELRNLSPRDFTKLCGLSTLDLTGSIYAQDACTYKSLTTWFIEKHITVIPDVNSIYNPESEETRRCPGVEFSEEDISTHSECRLTIRTKKLVATARKTWIIIVGTVVGVIVVLFIFFFWLHRRNVKQTKNVKKMLKQNEIQNNKPEKLLSDVS